MDILDISFASEIQFAFVAHSRCHSPLAFLARRCHSPLAFLARPLLKKYPSSSARDLAIPIPGISSVRVWDVPISKCSVVLNSARIPVIETSGTASTPAALVQAAGSPREILDAVAELPLPGEENLHFQLQLHHQRKRLV